MVMGQKFFGSSCIVFFVILVSIRFWSFVPFAEYGMLNRFLSLFIDFILLYLIHQNKNVITQYNSYYSVKYIIIALFLSALYAMICGSQSLWDSFNVIMILSVGYIFYFYLCKINFSEHHLLNIVFIISVIWTFLEIIQQITYPVYFFAGREEGWWNGELENRMGLWRFYIWGIDLVILAYCYRLYVAVKKFSLKNFIFVLIPFIGIACYCSRKHLLILVIVTLFIILSNIRKKWSLTSILIIGISIVLIYVFGDSIVEMNEKAVTHDGEGEDFIRYLSGEYFLTKYGEGIPLYYILGAGVPGGASILNTKIVWLQEFYGFYQQDVGIIGYYSWCGIIGVLSIIYCLYRTIIRVKYLDTYLVAFFIAKLVLIVFDFWAMWQVGIVAYSIFLYIADRNILSKKHIYENRSINVS